MPMPTTGMPVWRLTNNHEISYWYESESECLWFIYRVPGEPEYRGGGLNFQMGETYITFRKGPQEYSAVCIAQINAKIKELFPALFPPVPPPDEVVVPPEIANLGPLSEEFCRLMMIPVLVNNQLVQ